MSDVEQAVHDLFEELGLATLSGEEQQMVINGLVDVVIDRATERLQEMFPDMTSTKDLAGKEEAVAAILQEEAEDVRSEFTALVK